MKRRFLKQLMTITMFGVIILTHTIVSPENIDPDNDGSQYAYGENAGWLNFEPQQGEGVTVTATKLTGYVWAENIGWINLSPTNFGGVVNDGNGNLSGYAWGENVGWINFNPPGSQVTIDPSTGEFAGYAWSENLGWISFSGTAIDSTPYKVKSDYLSQQQAALLSDSGNSADL